MPTTEFAAMIAIDWADQKHAWAMQTEASKIETGAIAHTPEAIDVWAAELRTRFGGQHIAVALEQSRGSLVFMLTKYDHFVIFPVHPTILVNYRLSRCRHSRASLHSWSAIPRSWRDIDMVAAVDDLQFLCWQASRRSHFRCRFTRP